MISFFPVFVNTLTGLTQQDHAREELFTSHQIDLGDGQTDIALPPEEFNRLAKAISERFAAVAQAGRFPALVTSKKRRRFVQNVLAAKGIRNPVLSFEEIGTNARPALLGTA